MTVAARPLSRTLATVTAELELDQASYVTLEQIAVFAARHHIASSARDLAWRLRKAGWLLETPTRGVWEFAPAVNAGPYGRGDAFALLRGLLERRSMSSARVCLISALWLRGWSERAPSRHEIAVAKSARPPSGTNVVYKVFRFESHLPAGKVRGLPVEVPATTLVHLATRPAHVTSWEAIANALPDMAANTDAEELRVELQGRPPTVSARLGYLLEGVAPHLVEEAQLRPTETVTHLGPRGAHARYNARWNVADSQMPVEPSTLKPLNPLDDVEGARRGTHARARGRKQGGGR